MKITFVLFLYGTKSERFDTSTFSKSITKFLAHGLSFLKFFIGEGYFRPREFKRMTSIWKEYVFQ